MRKVLFNLALLVSVLLVSCADNDGVNIISVNTFGSKVCRNDVVKVFVSVEVDDLADTSYEWGCDGGSFTNPPGLFENVWKAPDKAGTYEIWCTVKCGGSKQTRRAKMEVTEELYYTNFETPYYNEGFTTTNVTLAYDATTTAAKLTGSNDTNSALTRSWNNIAVPFSMQIDLAPNGGVNDTRFVALGMEFPRLNNAMNYVTKAQFKIYPQTGEWRATYTKLGIMYGEEQEVEMGSGSDEKFKIDTNSFKRLAVSLDNNNKFIVYYEGEKCFESADLAAEQSTFVVSKTGVYLNKSLVVLIDNWFIFDNGTFCTATAIDR